MGALIGAHDWTSTALGPLENWSQGLRTAVSIILSSRYPMFIWWGRELVNLYNDAYGPFLGKKHPDALGRSARQIWAEIWDQIGPRTDAVLERGQSTYDEALLLIMERFGYREETYFTFSYSPIRNDQDAVAGLFCAVTDETRRVIGERRLRLLGEVAASSSETHTPAQVSIAAIECMVRGGHDLPFALIYLTEGDGRSARLAAHTSIHAGWPGAARVVDLDHPSIAWPNVRTVDREPVLVKAEGSLYENAPTGPWDRAPERVAIVTIGEQGQPPAGFLVVGLNPYLLFDEDYRGFLNLLTGQISAGISAARAYEGERRRAEALAEIDRAKTVFFTNVSHEFRTPLTLMLGPLEDALAGPTEALPGRRADLALVHRNGQRLLRLVNTLLDFSRIEAGRVQASFEPVDLAALTADLASVFRAATDKAGLSLAIECPPLPEPVWVDREMWEKIVLNLLSNAFKFTLEGGITVRLGVESGRAVLTIEDSGTGIPAHELPRLFERFHRVDGASGRTHEGTGIGLALVHELARQHGGTVRAESILGEGSRFTVSIPLGHAHLPSERLHAARSLASTAIGARPFVAEAMRWLSGAIASDEGVAEQLPTEPLSIEADTASRPMVLLADDNADMRDYVRRLLATRYEVRTAEDGAAALAAAREHRPDLLLSDVMMPRLDGVGLLREIRADPALADLPVVLLSARAGEEASIEGLEAGADDYLIKPFTARELLARIASTLKMAALRSEFEHRTSADLAAMTRLQQIGRTCIDASAAHQDCLRDVLDAAVELTGADKGNVQLINPNSGALEIAVQRGFDEPFLRYFVETDPASATACTAALRSRERVVVEDVETSELFAGQPSRAVLLAAGVRAVQSVPLLSGTGAMLGVVSVHYAKPRRPTERDMRLMDLLARQAADYLERRQAERALRDLNNSLEQKVEARTRALETEMIERQKVEIALQQVRRLEAVGQLTGGIAHDFNNLLTVVLSLSESIAMAASGNERITRMAATTQRAAERGAQLTSQLLSFSGKQQLRPVTVAVDGLVRNVGDLVRRTIGENITMTLTVPRDLWPSHLDPAQLESAILNLAINARDAMPRGGNLVITARNRMLPERDARQLDLASSDYVVVSVTDTGSGMTPEVRRRAFEPFFTTKEVGKGSGLGLSQIYGFMRQSGGIASIDSAPGVGTTVSLYFPRATQPLGVEPSGAARAERRAGAGKTVLVVEDQPDVRDVIEMSLTELDYRVLVAPDGVAARRLLNSTEAIDLLLTDVVMPGGVNGLDLAQDARRLRQDIKIVVVSGFLRDNSRASDVFGLTFLEKPFLPGELTSAVAAALAGNPMPRTH